MKKYEMTKETKTLADGTVLHRIRALMDISRCGVKAGDLGGWIETYDNLSQHGESFVFGDALVCDTAEVCGDALVCDTAKVRGNAKVCDTAWVFGNAKVCDTAWVFGNAKVYGDALVCGNAKVFGDAKVYGDTNVYDTAKVCGDALAMREAMENISEYAKAAACHTEDAHLLGYLNQIERWAEAALSAPPRNCDVGTVDEQVERFQWFCDTRPCDCCKLKNKVNETLDCAIHWAQLPYEEGVAK